MAKSTVETFFKNRIKIYQPEDGYRYSMDPVILAAQVVSFPGCKIIDIGCGCGIIPLILGFRHKDTHIIGVEIQSQLAQLATKNISQNMMSNQIQILNQDIRTTTSLDTQGLADIIVSNPPYKKKNSGRLNPNIQKAVARHEIKLELSQFFSSAHRLLKPLGQLLFIFPADRLEDIILAIQPLDFKLNWIRFIHTKKTNNAKLILVSGLKEGHGSCIVRPPLYIYDNRNNPTNEYTTAFNP
ncbi:MAG: methyltransferase [Desulfobacteraceae bacterium]|nr:methyltransferase [Desulfobacteraceae bacterium]